MAQRKSCIAAAVPKWLCVALVLCVSASGVFADEPHGADRQIYLQRTAEGGVVLTDRPVSGAVTQRTWQTEREDAPAARERREAARLEALSVSERIERQLDAQRQRDHEFSLERLRLAQAEAALAAARANAEAAAQAAIIVVPRLAQPRFARPAPMLTQPRAPRGPRPPVFGMWGAQTG